MIKKFLNSHVSTSVASAAFLITITGLISRFVGLFRDRLLALNFGAGDVLDVYYAAFRIPDLIYNLLILGALSAAFIPIFTGLVSNKKDSEAWQMADGIIKLAIISIVFFSFLFCLFSPYLMKIITPGFSQEKIDQTVFFTRIMFLSPLLLGISGIFGGILTSYKRFLIYSLAPIFYNLGIVFGILFFVKFWGPIGLAWGVVLGSFLHLLIQYPMVRQLGLKKIKMDLFFLKDKNIRKILRLMIPRTMGIAVNQINLFVMTFFASTLASGSLAIFSLAQNLQSVPLGVIGVSFAIAVFPVLSFLASRNEDDKFIKTFSETFRQILFFVIPISVFIILLRAQIVRVVLGAGEFSWEDTILTFQCLGIFSLSLFAQSVIPLLARTFYAMQNTKIPFYVALVSEGVAILTVITLIGKYKILSLAIAFSLASLVQMFLLLFILRFKHENLDDNRIINFIFKIVVASFFGGVVVQLFKYLIASIVNMNTFIGVFTQLIVASFFGGVVFLLVCHLIKMEEFNNFKDSLTRKIFKMKKIIIEESANEVSGIK